MRDSFHREYTCCVAFNYINDFTVFIHTRHNKAVFTDSLPFILIDEPSIQIYNSISNVLKYTFFPTLNK